MNGGGQKAAQLCEIAHNIKGDRWSVGNRCFVNGKYNQNKYADE